MIGFGEFWELDVALLALTSFAQAFRRAQIESGYTVPLPPSCGILYNSAFPFILSLIPVAQP